MKLTAEIAVALLAVGVMLGAFLAALAWWLPVVVVGAWFCWHELGIWRAGRSATR